MPTQVGNSSALNVKAFSVGLFAATQRRPSFRRNMTGPLPKQKDAESKLRGQSHSGMPIVQLTDLSKSAGDTLSVDLFDIIKGSPVMGDNKLAGKMMSMSYSTQDVKIDQTRGGVEPGGRMAQKRTKHNLRTLALANLSGWAARLEDQMCMVHLAGARGIDDASDWVVPLESDPDFSSIVVNTILPPTRNRRYFGGTGATGLASIDTSDHLLLGNIDIIRADIDEQVFPLQPLELPGDGEYQDNPLFVLHMSARQWHWLATDTGTTDVNWRTFLANAQERSKGFNHPLFKGQCGMWNGILMRKTSRAIRFDGNNTVEEYDASDVIQNVTPAQLTDRAVLCGAQAMVEAFGTHKASGYHYAYNEEENDHGNNLEVSMAMMGGKSKVRFSVDWDGTGDQITDHGVATIDSYAPAPA